MRSVSEPPLRIIDGPPVIAAAAYSRSSVYYADERGRRVMDRIAQNRGSARESGVKQNPLASSIEYVACSPGGDGHGATSIALRLEPQSGPATRPAADDPASAAHVAYAIDMGGCMEVIAIGLRTGAIEINFQTGRSRRTVVETADANAAAHQVGTPRVPHKAPPPPYAGAGL